jgi:hypothetical protein
MIVRFFRSWKRWKQRWKHRKGFKEFDAAVDHAIKTDALLIEMRARAKQRIHEIIVEVGNK